LAVLIICAISVSIAIFLIEEMNKPLEELCRFPALRLSRPLKIWVSDGRQIGKDDNWRRIKMSEEDKQGQGEDLSPELLKQAMNAFKKRSSLRRWMKIHALAAGRVQGAMPASVRFSRPASFRPPCGRNCADRANSAAAAMDCMSCRGQIYVNRS